MRRIGLVATLLFSLLAACDLAPPGDPAPAPTPTARAQQHQEPAPGPASTPTSQPAPGPTGTALPSPTPDRTGALRDFLEQSNLFAFVDPAGQLRLGNLAGDSFSLWERPVTQLAWSPDGQRLAFVSEQQLYLWESTTAQSRLLLEAAVLPVQPSWSPDSAWLAIAAGADLAQSELLLVEVASGGSRRLGQGSAPLFAPAGSALLAQRSAAPEQPAGQQRAIPLLWPQPETAPLVVESAQTRPDWAQPAWSADGRVVAVGSVLLDGQGQIIERLGTQAAPVFGAGLSPDGRWLALVRSSAAASAPHTETLELAIVDRASGHQRTVWATSQPQDTRARPISQVVWSPDSTTLAFAGAGRTLGSAPLEGSGLWVGTADGSELGPLVGSEERSAAPVAPIFSPDGGFLLFAREQAIWSWELGSGQRPRLAVEGARPAWRP